jgi:hypothetical protein
VAVTLAIACGRILGLDDEGPGSTEETDPAPVGDGTDAAVGDCPGAVLERDPLNCGACGVVCPPGRACVAGTCIAAACDAGVPCDDGSGKVACVDVANDPLNCGGCGKSCNAPLTCDDGECQKLVFASSVAYTSGGFGGVTGADTRCQALALDAGNHGTFRAWISDGLSTPLQRFAKTERAYRLPNGDLVANGSKGLTSGAIATPIAFDERKGPAEKVRAWTSTRPNGSAADTKPCNGWLGGGGTSTHTSGSTQFQDARWTAIAGTACSGVARLYCFQQ